MPRQQPESGRRSPLRLRLGINLDTFRGINLENDPGAIGDDELQLANNIRILANGKIVGRGGQEKVNTSAMSGCVDGLIDDEMNDDDDEDSRLFYDKNGTNASTFKVVGTKAGESPEDVVDNLGANEFARFAEFEGRLIACNKSSFYEIDPAIGTGTLLDTTGATANDTDINGVVLHDFKLWFAAKENKVYTWDGDTVATVGTGLGGYAGNSPDPGGKVFRYKGDAYFTNAHVFKRYAGGTWTAVALPGSLTSFRCFGAVELLDVLYLFGADRIGAANINFVIVSYNGTATAVARTVTNEAVAANSFTGVTCAVVVDDVMYFGWHNTTTDNVIVGRYDGTTWTNTYHDVTADGVSTGAPRAMAHFDRRLWMSGTFGFPLMRSEQDDFTDAWTEVDSDDTAIAIDFVVFEG